MSDKPLGRICWYELLTTNPDDAPAFYGALTGWGTAPFEGADEPYTMWMNGEGPIGGMMQLPAEAAAAGVPPYWLIHISTPDLAATKAKAAELGATILHEETVPEVGSFAIVQDPQGAVFSAYEPAADAPGHDGPAALGEFSWHELATDGWENAWSFYSALFGWEKTDAMDMGEGVGMYQMWGRGAHPLGGLFNRPAEIPVSAWMVYVRVPDATAGAEKVKELGGTVLNGPMEVPGGDIIVQCMDPNGAAFALHSVTNA